MDQTRLAAAEAAYASGDWTTAAREYLAAAAGEIQGSGLAFHRAGNALLKLKRFDDAVAVYERALQDQSYGDAGAVACNLGTAKTSLGALPEAAKAFEKALAVAGYKARYRALQGLAGADFQMGRIEDAAEAYRLAALDTGNPDPGKALNNLGLCFVSLGRPEDAVEAYRAAVDLPGYKGRGRSAANLGMAYAALGIHDRAVASFERARDEFKHPLSGSMEAAYRASVSALNASAARVEGWTTGELTPVIKPPVEPIVFPEDAEEDDTRFFTITDAEMKVVDRDARRRERQEKARRPLYVSVLLYVALTIVVAGVLVAGYLAGIGYPTQRMTVNGVLEAYADGDKVSSYWVAVPATDVDKAMSSLPTSWASYKVGEVQRSARTSKVDVTVTLDRGGVVTYQFSLAREGVGWRINGVSTSFSSMGGGV